MKPHVFVPHETEAELWNEFVEIAAEMEPSLVEILNYVREGGATVKRYGSGKSVGMIRVSMAPTQADYHRWNKLNCGPGRRMYERVQAESKARWESRIGLYDHPDDGSTPIMTR